MIIGPRVYYAMARDRVFFSSLSAVGAVSRAPARAILLQGVIASLLVLTGSFDQILTYMGFSLGIFPILAVASLFKLRRRGGNVRFFAGYPFAPALYMSAGTLMLVLSFLERPTESILAIGTVLVGIPVYLLFRKRQSAAG